MCPLSLCPLLSSLVRPSLKAVDLHLKIIEFRFVKKVLYKLENIKISLVSFYRQRLSYTSLICWVVTVLTLLNKSAIDIHIVCHCYNNSTVIIKSSVTTIIYIHLVMEACTLVPKTFYCSITISS